MDVVDDPSYIEALADASMASRSVSSRGRKKIPLQRSRLVCMEHDREEDIVCSSINLDKQLPSQIDSTGFDDAKKGWTPLFYPKVFLMENQDLQLEEF